MTVDASRAYESLIGEDGWLFISKIDNVMEKHAGRISLTPDELRQWQLTLELRQAWLKMRGAAYAFTVAPNKASIYTAFLPKGFPLSPRRPLQLLKEHLDRAGGFSIVDPTDHLRGLIVGRELYYRTDEHWNDYGAFKAYEYLLKSLPPELGLRPISEGSLERRDRKFVGELSVVLENPRQEVSFQLVVREPQAKRIYSNKPKGRGKVDVLENTDKALPRAVIFRDSFASALLPFLAESFSRIVAVSSRQVLFDLVESERPDIVITEMSERYLDPAPDDVRMRSFESMCNVSLQQIRDARLEV